MTQQQSERRPGRSRLVWDKATHTIVAENPHAQQQSDPRPLSQAEIEVIRQVHVQGG